MKRYLPVILALTCAFWIAHSADQKASLPTLAEVSK